MALSKKQKDTVKSIFEDAGFRRSFYSSANTFKRASVLRTYLNQNLKKVDNKTVFDAIKYVDRLVKSVSIIDSHNGFCYGNDFRSYYLNDIIDAQNSKILSYKTVGGKVRSVKTIWQILDYGDTLFSAMFLLLKKLEVETDKYNIVQHFGTSISKIDVNTGMEYTEELYLDFEKSLDFFYSAISAFKIKNKQGNDVRLSDIIKHLKVNGVIF